MSVLSCVNSRGTANINLTIHINRSQEYTYPFHILQIHYPENKHKIREFSSMCLERLIRSGRRALDPIKEESMKIGQSIEEHNPRGSYNVMHC
jgi:hypothetical protein